MVKIKREDEEEIEERAKKLVRLNKAKQFAQNLNEAGTAARNTVKGINGRINITPLIKEPPTQPSDVGKFGWITVPNAKAPIPYFFFEGVKYVSSRIINVYVYTYFPKFPKEIYECTRIPSYPLSDQESQLLNEINFRHSDSFFGDILFRPTLDNKITLDDFEQSNKFYMFCNKLLFEKELKEECCGFIRIDGQSYVPFIRRESLVLLPIFYFEGDNCYLSDISLNLTTWEMTYLRLLCQIQQIKKHFFSGPTCHVMDLKEIKKLFSANTIFEESWPNKLRTEWTKTLKKSQPVMFKPSIPNLLVPTLTPINLTANNTSVTQPSHISTNANVPCINNNSTTQPKVQTKIISRYNNVTPNTQSRSQAVISNVTNSNITLNIHRSLNTTPNTKQQLTSATPNCSASQIARTDVQTQPTPVMSISNVSNSNININVQTRSSTSLKNNTCNTKSTEQASLKKGKFTYHLRPKVVNSNVRLQCKPNNKSANFGIVYPPNSTDSNSNSVTSNENAFNPTISENIAITTTDANPPPVPGSANNALHTIDQNTVNSSINLRPVRKAIALQHSNIIQINEKSLPEFFAKHGHNFVEVSKIALSPEQQHLFEQYYHHGPNNTQRIVQLLQTTPNPGPIQNKNSNENCSRDPRLQNKQSAIIPLNLNNLNTSSNVNPRLSTETPQTIASEVNIHSVQEPYTVGTILVHGKPFVCINLKPHTDKKCENFLISTTDIGMTFFPHKFLGNVDTSLKLAGLRLYKLCNSQRIAFERSGKIVGRDEMFVHSGHYVKEFSKVKTYL